MPYGSTDHTYLVKISVNKDEFPIGFFQLADR